MQFTKEEKIKMLAERINADILGKGIEFVLAGFMYDMEEKIDSLKEDVKYCKSSISGCDTVCKS